ncbi:SseB family protein [Streptomyces sp. H39-S7]|uniref:SseB family protein n=1 Tax=Streptomyces sp. H39-S7 TaxID=3004357 RepID=UPI0022AFD592|nr:SseB family protein [Streptomyces sp. H39-S7]MCZ4119179.1 SseB family protein [Streptomyces sp. H39-S7]
MTDIHSNGALPPAQQALHDIAKGGENVIALSTLALSDVLLPVPAGPDDAEEAAQDPAASRAIQLPVYEQEDGVKLVPVFTSEERLAQALPGTQRYRLVPLSALTGSWPSDELTLAIDTGSPDALSIAGPGVRALAALSGSGPAAGPGQAPA